MRKLMGVVLAVALFLCLNMNSIALAKGKPEPKPQPNKIHFNNNRFYFGGTTYNKPQANASANASASALAVSGSQAIAAGGNASVGDISTQAAGGNASVGDIANQQTIGDVTGIEGGLNFSIKNTKHWPTLPNMFAPNIQPQFDYEVEDGSDFIQPPPIITREMAEKAVPERHPIQGFFKKLKPLTGVFELEDAEYGNVVILPMDAKCTEARQPSGSLADIVTGAEKFPNDYALLENGLVYVWAVKITGKPAIDSNLLFNAMAVKAMDLGMSHYTISKAMKKKVATSEGNNLMLTGDILGANGNAWGVGAGGSAEKSHIYNDSIHSFHLKFYAYDPVRANEKLQELAGLPPITSEEDEVDGKYVFRVFSEYARLKFGLPEVVSGDEAVLSHMGSTIVENWDLVKQYGMQAVFLIHRDERPAGPEKKNREINGRLGLETGKNLRELVYNLRHVQNFLKENAISKKEWEDTVVYATTGADHPLIRGSVSPDDHQANRTAHLAFIPGGIRSDREPSAFPQNENH